MNKKQMECLLNGVLKQYATIIEMFINDNSEDEILSIKMSKEEKAVIEKHGYVFYKVRNKIYCLGSIPFKIIS